MDFSLQWHQRQFQETVRAFLAKAVDLEYLQASAAGGPGFSRLLHSRMAEMGLLSIGWFSNEGEAPDAVDVAVLYEELGRAAAPGPHFVTGLVVPLLLSALGRRSGPLLEGLASGRTIATLAFYEDEGEEDLQSVETFATPTARIWTLNGAKSFVPYADSADTLIVLARADGVPDGLAFFEVARGAEGLRIEALEVLSGERECSVELRNVVVNDEARLASSVSPQTAMAAIRPMITVAQSAELVGLATWALETAVAYSKDRAAFGHPIGSYQAIQHKCADMLADVDAARFLVYQAACLVNQGAPADERIPMCKAFAASSARRVTKEAHQILAGAGFVLDHALNFYYRRVKGVEATFGDVNSQLDLVAESLLRVEAVHQTRGAARS